MYVVCEIQCCIKRILISSKSFVTSSILIDTITSSKLGKIISKPLPQMENAILCVAWCGFHHQNTVCLKLETSFKQIIPLVNLLVTRHICTPICAVSE